MTPSKDEQAARIARHIRSMYEAAPFQTKFGTSDDQTTYAVKVSMEVRELGCIPVSELSEALILSATEYSQAHGAESILCGLRCTFCKTSGHNPRYTGKVEVSALVFDNTII
jgi:hypothetical protein